jgi:hypothetical protein
MVSYAERAHSLQEARRDAHYGPITPEEAGEPTSIADSYDKLAQTIDDLHGFPLMYALSGTAAPRSIMAIGRGAPEFVKT